MATPTRTAETKKKSKVKRTTEGIANRDRSKKERQPRKVDPANLVPTGSTLLNLACSDRIEGGWPLGKINTMPGASTSGKTMVALSSLAAVCGIPRFDQHRLIYDDVEQRQEFDMDYLFGERLGPRLESPPKDTSDTVEDFEENIAGLAEQGQPFIYVLDSLDALTTREELEKEMVKAMAVAKGKDAKAVADAFAGRKAAIIGRILRQMKKKIARTNSMVLILQQMRINIGAGPFGKKYRVAGGEAPYFMSHVRPILSRTKTWDKTVRGQKIKYGVRTLVDMEKNSITGKNRKVTFNIYYDLGIDDLGSMIDYLLEVKQWSKTGQTINAKDLDLKYTRDKLITYIEKKGLEPEVQKICQRVWSDIENAARLGRKRRF